MFIIFHAQDENFTILVIQSKITFYLSSPSLILDDDRSLECWICYDTDRQDRGSMIQPCNCKGDVGAVHHDCLRRWLVEVNDFNKKLTVWTVKDASCEIYIYTIDR